MAGLSNAALGLVPLDWMLLVLHAKVFVFCSLKQNKTKKPLNVINNIL